MTTPPDALADVRARLLRAAADQEGRTRHWRDCAAASASNVCGYPKEARDALVAAYERKVRDSEEATRFLRALAAAFGDGALERVARAIHDTYTSLEWDQRGPSIHADYVRASGAAITALLTPPHGSDT